MCIRDRYHFHKVPGKNFGWAVIAQGRSRPCQEGDCQSTFDILVKVDTVPPYDYQAYRIPNLKAQMTDFAVSPDGETLYIAETGTGRVVKWSPNFVNNPPVCSVSASPASYQGPAPAAITFDASSSYDPDPGDTLSFSWDFDGDSIFGDPYDSGTDSQPVKNYYENYTGPVTVRVTDNHNASVECGIEISVQID